MSNILVSRRMEEWSQRCPLPFFKVSHLQGLPHLKAFEALRRRPRTIASAAEGEYLWALCGYLLKGQVIVIEVVVDE